MTSNQSGLTRAQLRTPRAAAIAGILFSPLLPAVFWLMRLSVPADPHEPGAWLKGGVTYVAIALNLVPFARRRVSLVCRRVARQARRARGPILCDGVPGQRSFDAGHAFRCRSRGRRDYYRIPCSSRSSDRFGDLSFRPGLAYGMINIYLVKTAAVFMITTSTIALYMR
jgi:hypothetical protein